VVKVLFDHNMPPAIARALHALISVDGHEAFALKDRFDQKITDVTLYTELGRERDWIVISKDIAQAKRKPERAAVLRGGILVFYLAPSVEKLAPNQQAATILWHWEAMVRQRNTNENGLFLLPLNKGAKFRTV
jgi:PIN like domain